MQYRFTDDLNAYQEEYDRLAEKLSYYRKIRHITQQELSRRVGVSASYIAKIEGGHCLPGLSLDLFFAICCGLQIDPLKILRKEPEDIIRTNIRQKIRQNRRQFPDFRHYL